MSRFLVNVKLLGAYGNTLPPVYFEAQEEAISFSNWLIDFYRSMLRADKMTRNLEVSVMPYIATTCVYCTDHTKAHNGSRLAFSVQIVKEI